MGKSKNQAITALKDMDNKEVDDFLKLLTKEKSFIATMTPDLAMAIRTCCNGRNRTLTIGHYGKLSKAMSEGEWQFNNTSIGFFKDGMLADGQHRLQACIEANHTFETLVVTGLDYESMFTVDQQSKPRKIAEILEMEGVSNPQEKSFIATNYLKSYNNNGFTGGATSTNTALKKFVDMFDKELQESIDDAEIIMESHTNKMFSLNTASLALFFSKKTAPQYAEQAKEVLLAIVSGIASEEGHPGLIANRVLLKRFLDSKGKKLNINEKIGTLVKAINMLITGKPAKKQNIEFKTIKGAKFPRFI